MKPPGSYDRVVDEIEELLNVTLLAHDVVSYLVDRHGERKESAESLSRRVNRRALRARGSADHGTIIRALAVSTRRGPLQIRRALPTSHA
jgi:hypothetical protein